MSGVILLQKTPRHITQLFLRHTHLTLSRQQSPPRYIQCWECMGNTHAHPARASMQINAAKPTMARRPFQFSALVLQKELANGSFLVNPLQIKPVLEDRVLPLCSYSVAGSHTLSGTTTQQYGMIHSSVRTEAGVHFEQYPAGATHLTMGM